MENAITVKMMVYQEARQVVDKINADMNNIRSLVLDLYEREGWSALGYASWRECVTAEFKQGQAYLYYQLEAAKIERNISTTVEKEQIPERQLRPLAKLEPEQQRTAWQKAVETAPEGKVTAAHVSKVVKEITGEQPKPEQPKPKPTIPEHAIYFAQIAISQLERIADDDPTRWDALEKVESWIKKYRKEHNNVVKNSRNK